MFSSALLDLAEADLIAPRYCPMCGHELEQGITLISIRGKRQRIVGDEKIGARCADGKNLHTWMLKVPVVIVEERKESIK